MARQNQARYAFVGWIASLLSYVAYLVWAFAPAETLHAWGVTYYPSKEWAVSLPAFFLVCLLYSTVLSIAVALLRTPRLDDLHTLTDVHAKVRSAGDGDDAVAAAAAVSGKTLGGAEKERERDRVREQEHVAAATRKGRKQKSGAAAKAAAADRSVVPDIGDLDIRVVNSALY